MKKLYIYCNLLSIGEISLFDDCIVLKLNDINNVYPVEESIEAILQDVSDFSGIPISELKSIEGSTDEMHQLLKNVQKYWNGENHASHT